MIDHLVIPVQHQILAPFSRLLHRRGTSANAITVAGFALGALVLPLLAFGYFGWALVLILANRLSDGLDGSVARLSRPTSRGAFLDIALDFVFYALVPLGFALADPAQNAIAAAVLIASFVGTGSSFLAFAVIAAKTGKSSARFPHKGIHYLGGLAEGTETILVFVAMCLWPASFPVLAYGFAVACLITTCSRWWQGWLAFAD
jgi:phosphatidylglycerophosphate synthase